MHELRTTRGMYGAAVLLGTASCVCVMVVPQVIRPVTGGRCLSRLHNRIVVAHRRCDCHVSQAATDDDSHLKEAR